MTLPKPDVAGQSPLGSTLAGQPEAVTHREFGDHAATRQSIFDNVSKALTERYPIENKRYRLEVHNVGWQNQKPFSLDDQKKAIMRGHTLEHKLTGDWHLVDKASGNVVDKKSGVIAHVPYLTDRGTYVYQGNEYTVANQMRLKPGVYTRQRDNGDVEAHVNVKPGTGPSFRVHLEPNTGVFRLGVGQSNLKLYPILRAMGASDKDIAGVWGDDLLARNIEAEDPRAVSRAFMRLVSTRADHDAGGEDTDALKKLAFDKLEYFDPRWICTFCDCPLGGIPCDMYEGHHFHRNCLSRATLAQKARALLDLEESKEGSLRSAESDRKWSYLWHTGKLATSSHNGLDWVLLEVHKGLCDAAHNSVKSEGIDCDAHFSNPHISVLRPEEIEQLKKKFGQRWQGAAKVGQSMRFRLEKIVNLIPHGWKGMDRVWFLECASPDLENYRKELGLTPTPRNPDDPEHEMRFHITFAVRRSQNRKAAELLELIQRPERDESEEFDKEAAEADPGKMLAGVFNKMELDPEVTQSTLGQRHTNASIPMILRTSQKLLNINHGKEDTDDRDSLAFQTLHSAEDMFGERIRRDAGQVGRKLLWKSTLRGNLQHMPSGVLTPQIRSVLLKSGLGQPIEEINPMDAYDQNLRVLRLGEGGITSIQAVPDEARNVQPSHFGFIDPIRAPESEKMGVDARVAHGTLKGSDGQFYTTMTDRKTGKPVHVSAAQAAHSVVAFPGEFEKHTKQVRAMVNAHQVEYVNRNKVHFELPHTSQMFNASSNLVPLVSAIKGGRLLMGAKYITQALPLQNAEAPLVQNMSDTPGKSFDELYGERVGAVHAKDRGVVHGVDKNGITVMYPGGKKETHQLYDNFPFNRKTFIHNTPAVNVGDQVKPGQLLARSNYTDGKGSLAIGTNLRTAYLPYKGLNFEDAIVISESAAKRLASEHMYQKNHDVDDDTQVGRKSYISMFPSRFKPDQIQHIGHEGVVKPGTVVKQGDPLILSLSKAKSDAIHRGHKPMWSDNVMTWDHHHDGVVTDVDRTKEGGWNVTVKSYAPAQEGDKLAGRYGDKGVISRIVPDHKMVHDKEGNPYHILLNPLGVISRANPAQVFESVLGKIARKTGQPYKLPGFLQHDPNDPQSAKNILEHVQAELTKHGLSDTEDLTDPETGRKIPKVLTGERFIMKLHHTAEAKGSGRDTGAYTSEGIPAKGGALGAKRVSGMEQAALLSHGATEVLRDAQVVRGQRNDDYWRAFRMGNPPPAPKIPFVYNKFLGYLKGAGINVEKTGNRLRIFAMTNKDVDKMSTGEITTPETVSGDKLQEIPGGLFDRHLTGGHQGEKWSHISLHEPLPNPVMEEPIRSLLGVTQNKFEDIIAGREQLNGKTGSTAIHEALSRVNVEDSIQHFEDVIKSGPKTKRDKAIKALGYLKGLQNAKLQPTDLLLSKVPVLPPNMRPITAYRDMTMPADANMLYKDLMMSNNGYKLVKDGAGEDAAGEERLRLYNAFKAVTGLGEPISEKLQEKGVKGLLAHVFGKGSPKTGMFQRRVLGSPVDVVGRASITPNPDLDMDHVGIPESKAWTIYRPFIMRRLLRRGMPATEAARAVANQSKPAMEALQEEMGARPVIINRAPTLHRYGFMAAWPKLVKNDTLQLPPVACAGFNADFDGDAMNYHVPVTEGAVKDAIEKMMPSRNLQSVRDFKVHYTPKNEFLLGLHLASAQDNKNEHRIFKDRASALAAYQRGELDLGDRIEIHE